MELTMQDRLLALENAVFQRLYGKYAGRVEDVSDPLNLGRIKVSVPAVLHTETHWAMPCVPYAGPQVGFYFIPPVGAGVWVEFEGGDVSRPIWVGCFWSTGDLPPDATGTDVHVLATAKTTLKMDDSGSGEVEIANQQNAKVTWSADVATEAGTATHTVGADGVVSESAPGKVEVGASGVSVNNGAFTVM
jgi:uncharacterized protein involved in type VI secretion and phage assembly